MFISMLLAILVLRPKNVVRCLALVLHRCHGGFAPQIGVRGVGEWSLPFTQPTLQVVSRYGA